ncbi:helix-turn-helix domain-containing protein [Streptomyces griseorubiginosus]|uniref:helix-turn-helix domain-containing protein n=1 Tax=Streptomyces griseorubiginosus TaxID=67304 RepID=UPI0036323B9D
MAHTMNFASPAAVKARDELTTFLRIERVTAGRAGKALAFSALAAHSGIAPSALCQVENGVMITWRLVEGHLKGCTHFRAKARAKAVLAKGRRLFDRYEEASGGVTAAKLVEKRANAYWNRSHTLKIAPGMNGQIEGLHCLSALYKRAGLSLRGLAEATDEDERLDKGYSHSTLSKALSSSVPLTPDHLRAILAVCSVPEEQWHTWSNFFAKHDDPDTHDETYWILAPTPERLATLRTDFGEALDEALGDAVSNRVAEQAGLDLPTVTKLFAGDPVPSEAINGILKALTAFKVPRSTIKKLTSLAQPLQLSTLP